MRTRQTVTGTFSDIQKRETRSRLCSTSAPWSAWSTINQAGAGYVTTKTVQDLVTPGFNSLLKRGKLLPLNPFVVETVQDIREHGSSDGFKKARSCSAVSDTFQVRGTGLSTVVNGYGLLPIPTVPDAVITAVSNGAVAAARSAVWDTLTFMGEFRETQEMFRHTAGRFTHFGTRAANAARRAKSRNGIITSFNQYWLEYRYGWSPAIRDLQSAIAAFNKRRVDFERGRSSQTIDISDEQYYTAHPDTETDHYVRQTIDGTQVVRGWAACSTMGIDGSQQRFGLDPLVTAYELVTFSFVLDWFIQVGTWIQAVSPFQPGKLLGVCASIRTDVTRTVDVDASLHDSPTQFAHGGGNLGRWTQTISRYERFISETDLPGWNPRITPVRIIDAVALALSTKLKVLTRLRI